MKTRVAIDVREVGMGKIVVDGVDMSQQVYGFDLRCRVGETSKLTLYLHPVVGYVNANEAEKETVPSKGRFE